MKAIAFVVAACTAFAAQAGEVTLLRPTAFIGADTTYYVMVDGRLASDLDAREHVRLTVAPGKHLLAVRCPKPMLGTYAETAYEHEFGTDAAFLVVEPKYGCVTITPVDARAAASLLANTRLHPAGSPSTYIEGMVAEATDARAAAARPTAAPAAAAAARGAKDEVAGATAAWIDAFNSRDPSRIAALYDADAVLIGTSAKKPAQGSAAIAAYFADAPKRPMNRVALGEHAVRVYGDTAIDSGLYNFFQVSDGKATLVPARYTLVYRRREGKWLIVEHHSSRVP